MAEPQRSILSVPSKGPSGVLEKAVDRLEGQGAFPAPDPQAAEAAVPIGEELVYLPGRDDPSTVKWRGILFEANVPKRVTDSGMIAAARENPFYRVGNAAPASRRNESPKTGAAYRVHAVNWIRSSAAVEDLVRHWRDEANLRNSCEVGADDIAYLGSLIDPKLQDLAKAEELDPQQVARIWIRHGILELPWRR